MTKLRRRHTEPLYCTARTMTSDFTSSSSLSSSSFSLGTLSLSFSLSLRLYSYWLSLLQPQPETLPMDTDEIETPTINLIVATQDGHKLHFRMKRNTKLSRLLLLFCQRKQVSYRSMRFLYNGKRIDGRHTPDFLNMEDGDEIDAMSDQDGGGAHSGC